jgi:hypothetical protein
MKTQTNPVEKKLSNANNLVKKYISEKFDKDSWVYIDFVKENRFLDEIQRDSDISIKTLSANELAEYAIENITNGVHNSNLFGF